MALCIYVYNVCACTIIYNLHLSLYTPELPSQEKVSSLARDVIFLPHRHSHIHTRTIFNCLWPRWRIINVFFSL